ncbi:MAG: hypothetical protein AB8G05_09690 [Oligoflexales bacterium]
MQSFGSLFISNLAFANNFNTAISEDVASGVSNTHLEAFAKSMSEYVERVAFREGKKNGQSLCQTNRSEGFAAYPYLSFNKNKALDLVREISLCESIERFSWPYFWSDKSVKFEVQDCKKSTLNEISNLTGIASIQHVFPALNSDKVLCISIAKIGSQGAILGASCSNARSSAITGSIHELIKHYIGLKKINGYTVIESDYIKRLHHLSKVGFSLYQERLSFKGTNTIHLPSLEMDGLVTHPFDRYFLVYRTRFKDQVEFISESLNLGYI